MIVVNKIIPQTVELFSPDDISMGFVNEYELYDIRIQIMTEKVEGYYCLFDGEKLLISTKGKINFRKGFFDVIDNQLDKLMGI